MRALFITPVLPAPTGNGLAMRAGIWLDALSAKFETDVALAGLFAPHTSAKDFSTARAASITKLTGYKNPQPGKPKLVPTLDTKSRNAVECLARQADVVVILRLYLAELAEPATRAGKPVIIDIDDLDWVREERLGDQAGAEAFRAYAKFTLGLATVVTSASSGDAELAEMVHSSAPWHHVPNGVRRPLDADRESSEQDIDLLFVGSLSYAPNVEAATWLVDRVVDALPDVSVALVGAAPDPTVQALAGPRITVAADVEEVGSWYRRSRVCVVPIQSGAGTRIKIPEAWAHRRPVVSTTIGAEGLQGDNAMLVADDPDAFARACRRLLDDRHAYENLVEVAEQRFLALYTEGHAVAACLEAVEAALDIAREQGAASSVSNVAEHPTRHADIERLACPDGYLVQRPNGASLTWLNSTAYIVLQLCTGSNAASTIARALRDVFELATDPDQAVHDTIAELVVAGLVTPGFSSPTRSESLVVAAWAPGEYIAGDVLESFRSVMDNLALEGIPVVSDIDRSRNMRSARNRAASRFLTEGKSTHILFLDCTPEALAAARGFSWTALLNSPHEVIGLPMPVGKPVWERAERAARSLLDLSAAEVQALCQDFDVTLRSAETGMVIENGFAEAVHCNTGALLVTRRALERMAGSNVANRNAGTVQAGIVTMQSSWGFFDPGQSQERMDLDEHLAFCERVRACGEKVMIYLTEPFRTRLAVTERMKDGA